LSLTRKVFYLCLALEVYILFNKEGILFMLSRGSLGYLLFEREYY
jgi:hypothetical protein